MSGDEQALRKVVADWIRFTQEERIDELMNLMTDDILFLTVSQPPMTKADFEAGSRSMVGNVKLQVDSEIKEVRVEGNFGWLWQDLKVKVTVPGQPPIEKQGKTFGLYRKGDDGKWRLMRDANLMP